jgi:hypothetical protein
MQEDSLRIVSTFNRDFADLESMAERIARRANPEDADSLDKAVFEAAKLIETRCAQGGTTMLFQPPRSALDHERLLSGLE